MIVIVDYGMGNLGSIQNMLDYIGVESLISSNPSDLGLATKIILPGVGAFDKAMANLESYGFLRLLNHRVLEEKIPTLGVCLGMQLLTKSSEEGTRRGLGWVDAHTVRFKFNSTLKIPHMGWNFVTFQKATDYFSGERKRRYYFVHSYHVVCHDSKDILATSQYGYPFVAAIKKDNILGVQFHPEKSHKYGMEFYRYFVTRG